MPGADDRPQDTSVNTEDIQQNTPEEQADDNATAAGQSPAEHEAADERVVGGASGDDEGADELEVEQLRARVQELEDENSSLKDQYLRKQAEFENFRKRMTKEKAEAISYANQELLQDLIQIIDDFERAIKSSEESRDFDAFHDGVAMIEKQFTSMLERKWGLIRFDSVGEEFDPQKHEAVMAEESENDGDKTQVLEEF